MKTPKGLDGNAGLWLITNKLDFPLNLHDLEQQFIDKEYCETRQRDGIKRYDNKNLCTSDQGDSSLDHSTNHKIFGKSFFFCLLYGYW